MNEPAELRKPGADTERRRALVDVVAAASICIAAMTYWAWDRSSTGTTASVPISTPHTAAPQPVLANESSAGESSNSLNDRGTAFYNARNYPAAEALFRQSIATDPNQALGYCNLGAVLTSQGRYDEAIPVLHRAIALDPSFQLARNNLAWAIEDREKHK